MRPVRRSVGPVCGGTPRPAPRSAAVPARRAVPRSRRRRGMRHARPPRPVQLARRLGVSAARAVVSSRCSSRLRCSARPGGPSRPRAARAPIARGSDRLRTSSAVVRRRPRRRPPVAVLVGDQAQPGAGHLAEAGVGGRLDQPAAAHLLGDVRLGQRGGQRRLHLGHRQLRRAQRRVLLDGELARGVDQRGHHLPALRGQLAQLLALQAALGLAQRGGSSTSSSISSGRRRASRLTSQAATVGLRSAASRLAVSLSPASLASAIAAARAATKPSGGAS